MATSYEDKIKAQAQQYLEPGEKVLSAFIARPSGATTTGAGGAAAMIGGRKVRREQQSATEVGFQLANPMALALTHQRLVVLSVTPPLALGKGGDVKGLVSAVPLGEVEAIEIKRLLVGKVVVLTVGGATFKLEAGAGADAKGLVDAFQRAATAA
jgi:hypothetical protein